jgi:hypothetical protein
MRLLGFLGRHATTVLIALFALLLTSAVAACKRGPVLDMRGNADGGVARASAVEEATVATLVNVRLRPTGQWIGGGTTGDVAAAPPSVLEAPHLISGACAHGFVSAPAAGPLCYRPCGSDADCPDDATCTATRRGRARSPKLCVAR